MDEIELTFSEWYTLKTALCSHIAIPFGVGVLLTPAVKFDKRTLLLCYQYGMVTVNVHVQGHTTQYSNECVHIRTFTLSSSTIRWTSI